MDQEQLNDRIALILGRAIIRAEALEAEVVRLQRELAAAVPASPPPADGNGGGASVADVHDVLSTL